MGNTGVMHSDIWSVSSNPSGLAKINSNVLALHYENAYLIKETGLGAASAAWPFNNGTAGVLVSFAGFVEYNESRVALSYGKELWKGFSSGIQLNYVQICQPAGYGNIYALVAAFGIQAEITEGLVLGFNTFNPYNYYCNAKELVEIPSFISAGAGYSPSDDLLICFEIISGREENTSYNCGTEFMISDKIIIRTGITYMTYVQGTLGLGFMSERLQTNISFKTHPVLGISTALTLNFNLKK